MRQKHLYDTQMEVVISLPFLKNMKERAPQAGVIIKTRTPDEQPEASDDDSSAPIEACAEELIRAVHAKDAKAAAMAIKDAFEILDSEPHEEASHIEPHSYEASKED